MSHATSPLVSSRPRYRHSRSQNSSINSLASITEPATPPSSSSKDKSHFWDSNKPEGGLSLSFPSFILDSASELENVCSSSISKNLDGPHKKNKQNSVSSVGARVNGNGNIEREFLAVNAKVPLNQLRDDILRLSKDQHGCRFLQKRIDASCVPIYSQRYANFKIIFEQVKHSVYELVIDPFGNYLIQKLIGYFQESDLNDCLDILSSNLFSISINQHGTRALQRIIDFISTESQFSLLVSGLKPYVIEMIRDLNGNHVIQKVLNSYPPAKCQFIYDSILDNFLAVATHKHGCCVLQKCLNHVTASQHSEFAKTTLDFENFSCIVNDQYGNYVLQYLMAVNSVDINYRLFKNFLAYGLSKICMLKFSSNVVEKLMINCYKNEVSSIEFSNLKFTVILQILKTDVNDLVNNAYGNYVMQTLTDILINPNANYFSDLPSGDRVMLPALRVLLDDNVMSPVDTLQAQIIKKWFQHCKFDSNFGKKLQFKIQKVLQSYSKADRRMNFVRPPSTHASLTASKTQATQGLHTSSNSLNSLQNGSPASYQSSSASHLMNFYPFRIPYEDNRTKGWPQESEDPVRPGEGFHYYAQSDVASRLTVPLQQWQFNNSTGISSLHAKFEPQTVQLPIPREESRTFPFRIDTTNNHLASNSRGLSALRRCNVPFISHGQAS